MTDKDMDRIANFALCFSAVGIVFCLVVAAVQLHINTDFCEKLGTTYERGGKARFCVDEEGRAFSMRSLRDKNNGEQ